MAALINEGTQFLDVNGRPIVNGYVYIGEAGQDPKINKITIYSDRQLSTVLANPQRTDSFGRTVNKIWIEGRYSLKVEDSNSVQKYQDLERGETPGTGLTVLTNVQGINEITAEAAPAITSYVDKALYVLTVAAVNTGPVTLDAGGGEKSVVKNDGENLAAGDWPADTIQEVYYNEEEDRFEWANSNSISTEAAISALTSTVNANYERVNFSAVRQTVQTGPVDSDGLADYIVNNGGLSVITSGLDATPLLISYGDGVDLKGEKNIVVEIDENITFSGLSNNSVNYLYLDFNEVSGDVTPGSTVLAPIYSNKKPTSPGTGQYWYPFDNSSRGEYWDGSAWVPVLRVFIGQATTSSGSVASVITYAYRGIVEILPNAAPSAGVNTYSHNVGADTVLIGNIIASFVSASDGWSIGDTIDLSNFVPYSVGSAANRQLAIADISPTSLSIIRGNDTFVSIGNKSTGGTSSIEWSDLEISKITVFRSF